jgi:hypothetical protein
VRPDVVHLRPIDRLAMTSNPVEIGHLQNQLVVDAALALLVLLVTTVLSW